MENNRIILGYCPNFDKIINNDFLEDDYVSLELVRVYHNFIFKIDIQNDNEVRMVQELDQAMGKYVDDYFFRKIFQKEMKKINVRKNPCDIVKILVSYIINVFRQYEEDATRKITISRWI